MIKFLVFNDLHISDKAPAGRIDDYRQSCLDKIDGLASLAVEHEANHTISTGDLFHQKRSNRVSDWLRTRLIERFLVFPTYVSTVLGNHDMGPDELESLDRQPIGTLAAAKAIHVLGQAWLWQPLKAQGPDQPAVWLIPRPYSNAREADPSYYSLTNWEEECIRTRPAPVLLVAHGPLLPPREIRPYPYVNVEQIPGIEKYDVVVSGHIHENLGIHDLMPQVGRPVIFANLGSVGRVARTQANYARTVQALLLTFDGPTKTAEPLVIPFVKPALEVFAGRDVLVDEVPSDEIQKFVELLGEGIRADQMSMEELIAAQGTLRPRVAQLFRYYLEEAQP